MSALNLREWTKCAEGKYLQRQNVLIIPSAPNSVKSSQFGFIEKNHVVKKGIIPYSIDKNISLSRLDRGIGNNYVLTNRLSG